MTVGPLLSPDTHLPHTLAKLGPVSLKVPTLVEVCVLQSSAEKTPETCTFPAA